MTLDLDEIAASRDHGRLAAAARFGDPEERKAADRRLGHLTREAQQQREQQAAEQADAADDPDMGQGVRLSTAPLTGRLAGKAEAERRFGTRAD